MDIYPQQPPFSIQVEIVEGCQLRCSFCGLNGIRAKDNNFKIMEYDTLTSLVSQIKDLGWNPRLEFAGHGEPTMHPNYDVMVELAYEIHPKLHLMMTSNGGGFLKGDIRTNIAVLFQRGLNILALDDYHDVKIIGKIRPHLDELCKALNISWYEYPENPLGNPHRRGGPPFISIVKDISISKDGTHSHLSNHAGSAAPRSDAFMGKPCAKPFREMTVRWDGNVAVSCDDWRGEYPCGNIKDGLLKVWLSPAFEAARRKLIRGERDFGPCNGCTARSYRVGLLPDKFGKDIMEPVDDETMQVIAETLAKGPLTKPVLRPWEVL